MTKQKHVPTWLYKQAHRLTGEMAEIRAELEKIGPFNAGRQREKILELLGQWYPQVNAFEAKLKPYDQQIRQSSDHPQRREIEGRYLTVYGFTTIRQIPRLFCGGFG